LPDGDVPCADMHGAPAAGAVAMALSARLLLPKLSHATHSRTGWALPPAGLESMQQLPTGVLRRTW